MFTDNVKQTTDDEGQKRIAKGYLEDQNDPKPRLQSKMKIRNQTWLKFQALEVRVGERGFNLEVRMLLLIRKVHYILLLTLDLRYLAIITVKVINENLIFNIPLFVKLFLSLYLIDGLSILIKFNQLFINNTRYLSLHSVVNFPSVNCYHILLSKEKILTSVSYPFSTLQFTYKTIYDILAPIYFYLCKQRTNIAQLQKYLFQTKERSTIWNLELNSYMVLKSFDGVNFIS